MPAKAGIQERRAVSPLPAAHSDVIAGLDPALHLSARGRFLVKVMDARVEPAHDAPMRGTRCMP
ncbi:hypothetical protein CCR97_29815 [Rhodoplanes elegans]|uniref:Uncharacterized protein n=1 Tax=Rhodoplanes elegans TaxID=29408 RepID=A0A327KSD4_9BRAD|nr:hypothetical protein [Rhodoplanes elegans]RAI40844.1 hypothetical protein CH338_05000 [Rhodoplanes elegans]